MKKTMILTSMALMSLVAVGCANEEVKDTQDNQPVISTNMEEVQTEGNANTKKPLIVYFSYGENSELPHSAGTSSLAIQCVSLSSEQSCTQASNELPRRIAATRESMRCSAARMRPCGKLCGSAKNN